MEPPTGRAGSHCGAIVPDSPLRSHSRRSGAPAGAAPGQRDPVDSVPTAFGEQTGWVDQGVDEALDLVGVARSAVGTEPLPHNRFLSSGVWRVSTTTDQYVLKCHAAPTQHAHRALDLADELGL